MHQIYRRTPMPKWDLIKLLCNFIDITLRHECSPENLLHIFRTLFPKKVCEGLFLKFSLNLFKDQRCEIFINWLTVLDSYFIRNTAQKMKFSFKNFFSKCAETVDLVTFTKETLNGKLFSSCSEIGYICKQNCRHLNGDI